MAVGDTRRAGGEVVVGERITGMAAYESRDRGGLAGRRSR